MASASDLDPGQQHAHLDRLGDIVVPVDSQANDHLFHLCLGRKEDDGYLAAFWQPANALGGLITVHCRHHAVHQYQAGTDGGDLLDPFAASCDHLNMIPHPESAAHLWVVIHQKSGL